ncbi:hypothetical protein HGM15179_009228 [Zosterops borbonicus]|uniref:Uncharacterized protein n=1 Tax=Zosterops borbonicus TaxID=364589 RepID=A0A8K1LL17_9PASS|nr:hypothetical protein HGM15179_009228 [Zosterops borbonicus]
MGKQLCPCSPRGSMGDAEIHPQPVGKCPSQSRWMPGGDCDPVGDLVERGPLLPSWSSLSLEDCTPWKNDPHHISFGRTAACESGPMLEKFIENCLLWEGPHSVAGEGLLSWSSGRKPRVMN